MGFLELDKETSVRSFLSRDKLRIINGRSVLRRQKGVIPITNRHFAKEQPSFREREPCRLPNQTVLLPTFQCLLSKITGFKPKKIGEAKASPISAV